MSGEAPGREVRPWRGVELTAFAGLGVVVVLAGMWGLEKAIRAREPFLDLSARRVLPEAAAPSEETKRPLRFGVATMVSAEATFSTYRRLVGRICRDVGMREAFVLRPSYADVRQELERGELDVAFVCTGTYVHALPRGHIKLLVQPEFEKGLTYRSLFIVPAGGRIRTLEDLRGATMAFTDPESNTGCLVPFALLTSRGHAPASFLGKVVFTGSHDRSIQATALEVVDVAAVDSLVWESHVREDSSLLQRVRVIWRSDAFGPPPVVVPKDLAAGLTDSLRKAFLSLDQDPEGREILSGIGIKRFVPARAEDYETAIELHRRLQEQGGVRWR